MGRDRAATLESRLVQVAFDRESVTNTSYSPHWHSQRDCTTFNRSYYKRSARLCLEWTGQHAIEQGCQRRQFQVRDIRTRRQAATLGSPSNPDPWRIYRASSIERPLYWMPTMSVGEMGGDGGRGDEPKSRQPSSAHPRSQPDNGTAPVVHHKPEDGNADNDDEASEQVLPPILQDFLARYPHPAFALRASSIFDALVVRANQFAPTGKAAFSHSSHSDSDPKSHSRPGQGEPSRHPAEERTGSRDDDDRARPTKPQRLTSQEQYEGSITEEERVEREQDLRDEQTARERSEADEGREPRSAPSGGSVVWSEAGGRSEVEADGFFAPGAAAQPSDATSPAAYPGSHTSAYGGRDSPFPPSVSRGGTPSLATASSTVSSYRARDIGPHPRAHARAERVLAESFSDDAPAYGRNRRNGDRPLDRYTLLEGGEQKSHDPSRTAEGAVTAMYEQRAQQARDDQEEDERATRDEEEFERARNEDEELWDREVQTSARMRDRSAERNASSGGAASTAHNVRETDGATRSSSSKTRTASNWHTSSEPNTSRVRLVRQRSGPTVGLREMLSPVWRNSKWSEMMAVREDAHLAPTPSPSELADSSAASEKATGSEDRPDSNELELLSVLSRTDAQECLAMLASVVETLLPSRSSESERQSKTPLAKLNHTVLVELNFPESSIYRHPPGSSFRHEHTAADSFASDPADAGTSLFFSPSVSAAQEQRRSSASPSRKESVLDVTRKVLKGELPEVSSLEGSAQIQSEELTNRDCDGSKTDNSGHGAEPATAIGRVIPANAAPVGVPPSNQNPAVPPPHHAIQQESRLLRPFIQIVATLYEEYDLVICTTISGNMPLPVTVTGSPEGESAEESRRSKAAAKERAREQRAREKASRARQHDQYDEEASRRQREAECHVEDDLPNGALPFAESEKAGGDATSPGDASPATVTADDMRPLPASPSLSIDTEGILPRASTDSFACRGSDGRPATATRPDLVQRLTSSSNTSVLSSSASTVMDGSPATRRRHVDFGARSHREPRTTMSELPAAVTGDLRALLGGDDGSESSFDFLQEKEARAALRRRGLAQKSSKRAMVNDQSDRRTEPSERHRDRANELDGTGNGPSGEQSRSTEGEMRYDTLAEVTEVDEDGASSPSNPSQPATVISSRSRSPAVLGYDEEDDDGDMDRLRRATRTGSYSSHGSDSRQDDAHLEAQLVQDQHDEDEAELQDRRQLQAEKAGEADGEQCTIESVQQGQTPTDGAPRAETCASVADARPPARRASRSASLPQPFDTGSHAALTRQDDEREDGALVVEPVSEGQPELHVPETPFTSAALHQASDPFFQVLASTECGRTIIQIDWSRTPLGPISKWAPELRSHIMATLASPFHTALWYGEENVLLYNDAYARLLGAKHPAAMGKSGAEGWSEVWDVIGPVSAPSLTCHSPCRTDFLLSPQLASQVMLGKTMFFQDQVYCIYRNGMLEETCTLFPFHPSLPKAC